MPQLEQKKIVQAFSPDSCITTIPQENISSLYTCIVLLKSGTQARTAGTENQAELDPYRVF